MNDESRTKGSSRGSYKSIKSLIRVPRSRIAAVDSKQGGAINYELITARLMTLLPISKWRTRTARLRDADACTSDERRGRLPGFMWRICLIEASSFRRIMVKLPRYTLLEASLASVRPRLLVSREREITEIMGP